VSDATVVELPPPPPQDARTAIVVAAELLWPAPATVEVTKRTAAPAAGHRVVREHLLVPSATRPRLIVPASTPRAAAAIAARRNGSGGTVGRLSATGAAALVRSGLADRLVADRLRVSAPLDTPLESVETHLAELLGTDVIVGLHVGTARVNRKPVLHAVDASGRTLAFVKVGHSESARALVRGEAGTLGELAAHSFSTLHVPSVIALSAWRDMELLVLSPLSGRAVRPAVSNVPYAAMRELAAIHGLTSASLADSAFVARLLEIPRTLRAQHADRYAAAVQAIRDTGTTVELGSWHGDWQPFNMARSSRDTVVVWDWERFATGRPLSFDPLHYLLQVLLHGSGVGPQVEQRFLTSADDVAVRGGADRDVAAATVASYVAEIAGRYLALAEGPDGELLARRASWTLGLLESCVARL
jgi:hypothetical protein